MVHFCSVLLGFARSKIEGIGKVGRTQDIMEKWWAFWRCIKHKIHSTTFFPQSSVTHVSVTLFPVAEALHSRAKQWKPGGDWCLTRYGKWTFYRAWLSAWSCAWSAQISSSCRRSCASSGGGWDALCPQSGEEAGETVVLSGDGVADGPYSKQPLELMQALVRGWVNAKTTA